MQQSPKSCPGLKVALLVQTSSDWSRQVLEGVAEYASLVGGWEFWLEPRGLYEKIKLPVDWQGDGVICRLTDQQISKEVNQRKLPAVNVSWLGRHSLSIPKVVSDETACAEMAADYFLQHRWASFGYFGPPTDLGYSNQVMQAFNHRIHQAGYQVKNYEYNANDDLLTIENRQSLIADWLKKLPKPTVLLVWTTVIGHEITLISQQSGFSVPGDVAILAVELDPLFSTLATVPVACIDQSPRRVGFSAADLLARMIHGEAPPKAPVLIPPRRISERLSVDTLFVKDEFVQKAIQFIREKTGTPIQVSDVASAVSLSRRALEQRFSNSLEQSPAQVIRQTKLSHALHLLNETNLSVREIAFRTGSNHVESFLRFFKRETGCTPTEYRDK